MYSAVVVGLCIATVMIVTIVIEHGRCRGAELLSLSCFLGQEATTVIATET